jgi:WW domain-binding protein 4
LVKPGSSSGGGAVAKTPQPGPSKPQKPADPWANYSTAASLGITDPDAERQKAEAERRQMEGTAGAWEVITIEEPAALPEAEGVPGPDALDEGAPVDGAPAPTQSSLKREAEAQPDDDDARQFKLRRKKLGAGLGELYDPGLIPIKLKPKKEEASELVLKEEAQSADIPAAPLKLAHAIPIVKWSSGGWSGPKEAQDAEAFPPTTIDEPPADAIADIQKSDVDVLNQQPSELAEALDTKAEAPAIKAEPSEVKREEVDAAVSMAPSSLFRKRKIPAGGTAGRGRRS